MALLFHFDQRLRAMVSLASTEPGISAAADAFDRDPFLLACANGTVDLRTGTLRPHNPADLISLGTDVAYDPDATCPRWLRFLHGVFDGDTDTTTFVRRAVGYSLTGDTREQGLVVLHGAGCNGKSRFIETVQRVVGEFAKPTPFVVQTVQHF